MKRITLTICAIAFVSLLTRATAQDDAMMKAWMDYMTPGEIHKMLAKDDGVWDEEITMWMAPGAPPTKSMATMTNTMILGGRYQQSIHKGDFGGMPFEGMSLIGYDNIKKMFFSSWVDNMGTGVMHMQGTWNPKDKTITLSGTALDPMTGKDCKVREVVKIIDENTQFVEMFTEKDGKEFKSMEIKLTRKK